MLLTGASAFAQVESEEEENIAHRFFMPAIQMGYMHHQANALSGGLFIQTSLEYKTRKGWFLRMNYDDFSTGYELTSTEEPAGSITGKIPMSELIGGFGYRKTWEKHHLFLATQSGIRFYGSPTLNIENNTTSLVVENRTAPVNRYTLGYEYEIDTRAYLTFEIFGSHLWEKKDFWEDDGWSMGATLGISANLF